ncbi:MAG: glycoside hydrolase family protein [Hormoscilla sp. GUM202]|nr:glycoside hydrolase family protein [Hormoscilla sp. GUM202]
MTEGKKFFLASGILEIGLMLILFYPAWRDFWSPIGEIPGTTQVLRGARKPLVMKGGDPYIRALMRTISASESNYPQPYGVLYGGEQAEDLSSHPDKCVTIVTGPNRVNCTTAAGRYQFLTTTWIEKARIYHPRPWRFLLWESYSFEPQYQDAVMHEWLSDYYAWGADIPQLLRQGEWDYVFRLLSGTWTSLGYGIESNSMTPYLPQIYQQVLAEEL